MKKNTKKGFTLVELLVVIAILAILASVSIVGYTAFINRAHESNAKTEAAQIKSTITSFTMTGEEYVLATVTSGESTTKYTVKADLYVYANGTKVSAAVATDLGALNDDFKDLPGTLTVNASGRLVYTSAEKSTITVTIE